MQLGDSLVLLAGLYTAASDETRCLHDTFGMAGPGFPPPYEKGIEELRCDLKYRDAATIEKFVLTYYPSSNHFRDYNGTDMVPERHFEYKAAGVKFLGKTFYGYSKYPKKLHPWVPGVNGPAAQSQRIKLAECDIPQPDGGAYSVQRVGPLVSTGNYDYWQFGWQDVWKIGEKLKRHPDGIMFTSSFSGAVEGSGKVLGHPPIHIHHIHVMPAPGVVTKMMRLKCSSGESARDCYVPRLAVEQHGDYQCTPADGGIDCLFERTADGYAKVVTTPLDLEGEINDVRAPSSEPLVWWYQVALRWFPKAAGRFRPLSQHFIVGPGEHNVEDQRNNVFVFPVNTRTQSVYWYSGRMEYDAVMVRNKLHSHNTMYDRSFFFRATPQDLGLDDPKFLPAVSSTPLLLNRLGFATFDALEAFLFQNLGRAAGGWQCPAADGTCQDRRPQLICQSWVSNEEFVDWASARPFVYDRRAPCCCRPWRIHKGEVFTVVAFLSPLKTAPGPWDPHRIPPVANMHIHWVMTFATPDNESRYWHTMYSQNPDMQVTFSDDNSRFPVFRMIEGYLDGSGRGHLRNKPLSAAEFLEVSVYWVGVVAVPYRYELLGLLSVLAVSCLRCLALCRRPRRAKRVKDHPAVRCVQQPCCPDFAAKAITEAVRYSDAAAAHHGD